MIKSWQLVPELSRGLGECRTLNIFSVESPPFPASPSTSHQLSTLNLNLHLHQLQLSTQCLVNVVVPVPQLVQLPVPQLQCSTNVPRPPPPFPPAPRRRHPQPPLLPPQMSPHSRAPVSSARYISSGAHKCSTRLI
jgi:hypothetical protein